jgi:hypothetical protein
MLSVLYNYEQQRLTGNKVKCSRQDDANVVDSHPEIINQSKVLLTCGTETAWLLHLVGS